MKGYFGKIIEVDLSTEEIKIAQLDEELAKKFIGGAGYAVAQLIEEIDKDTDPLGPENILFFMMGPLGGTMATSTGRMVVCAKSPYSGILGESNACSHKIKKAGYDGLKIKGIAKSPMRLEIFEDEIQLKPADNLWGKDIEETTELLTNTEETKRDTIIVIGPAGENLVNYALIGSEERAFGRTGLGAVMGSKKLKAISIRGKKKVPTADPDGLKEFTKKTNSNLMEITTNVIMQQLGTSSTLDMYNFSGELPVGYYRKPEFEGYDNISGATLSETFLKKNRHCYSCPIGCGRVVEVGENEEGLPKEKFEGPEYETLAGFGSMILNDDLKAIIKSNYLCNKYGLDTISASSVIALLMDLVEKEVINADDLDGIDLQWGNMDAVYEILKKISLREGIGDLLAQGSVAIGKKFGVDKDQIAAIRNIEPTYHDMRTIFGQAIAYGLSPHYGGSHNACDMYMNDAGVSFSELDIPSIDDQEDSVLVAQTAAKLMSHRALYSSLIMCVFVNPEPSIISEYLKLVTDLDYSVEDLKLAGERILTIKRLFNLKMGHTPKDEYVPKILTTPLTESGNDGASPDIETLFSEYYKFLDWDQETGIPSDQKIEKLGLKTYRELI